MKIIFTFLIIVLFFSLEGKSQINSDILLREETEWVEGLIDIQLVTIRELVKYEIKGDTLIEGDIYKKVYANGVLDALLREDNERTVYIRYDSRFSKKTEEIILYTFGSWKIGERISYSIIPDATFTETIKERDLSTIQLKDGNTYDCFRDIVRGIGDLKSGIMRTLRPNIEDGTHWLLISFSAKEQLLYDTDLNFLQTHLVTDGVHWVERHSAEDNPDLPDPASDSYELMHFRINGDTVLHGKTYKKVYRNDTYYTGLREEDAFNVWRTTEKGESLLYTFDWKAPLGRFTNERGEDFQLPAGSTERTSIAGGEYITCKVPYNPDKSADPFRTHNKDIRLILNIGLTSGIFSHIQPARDCYCFNDLVCFYDGDKLIYQNPVFTQTGEVLSIDTPRKEGSLSVLISGNEVIFALRNLSGKEHTVLNVYSAEGMQIASYSLQTGSVTVNDLPGGIYFYRLDKGKGMVETGKFSIIE